MTTDAVGGVWTYATTLAQGLAPLGVHVTLAVMGPSPDAEMRAEAAALPNVDVRERDGRLEWMPEPWRDLRAAGEWLLDLESEVRPDVVHLNEYAHADLAWRAPTLLVGHSSVVAWWYAVHGEAPPPKWDRYEAAATRAIESAEAFVAPTRAALRDFARHHASPRDGVVIPNARDGALFPPATKEPYYFASGRLWDKAKNVQALDRVAPHLPWPVLVAGDAAPPHAKARCPTTSSEFLGRLPAGELADRYAHASVFVHPARFEPFGLTALEAAHAGAALVLGDVPTLREVWGDAAVYAPPDEEDALRDALARLAENEDERTGLSARARTRATRYSPHRQAAAYLAAYRRLAGEPDMAAAQSEIDPCES